MKKILNVLLIIACLFLFACNKNKNNEGSNDPENKGEDPAPIIQDVYYNVKFDGTSLSDTKIKEGEKLSQPQDPKKDNYIFGGWYLDSAFSTKASFPIEIKADTTIYAKFFDLKEAFKSARENTIGNSVDGYEFDYTLSMNVSYSAVNLSGNTVGNTKYNKNGEIKFYDEHTNSGLLFYDGSKYQIRTNNELEKISLNEKGKLNKFEVTEVDDSYTFDSSSYAKALFEYSDDQLKSIDKTSVADEYKLNTSFGASKAIALVGNYANSTIVERLLGSLPETSVSTGMYVTFNNGEVKTYRYEMHINVTEIKFDLVYNLTFKNVGKAPNIVPKSFNGISITSSDITAKKAEINGYFNAFYNKAKSSYDFKVTTGVDFSGNNEINSTFKGSAIRKNDNGTTYFHNDIEVDSDFKNADLYKSAGIADIHTKKTMLSTKEVYNIEKKLLKDATYLVENYTPNNSDSYYLFDFFNQIANVSFIQKDEDVSKALITYTVGVNSSEVSKLIDYLNKELNLDPLSTSTTIVKVFGDYNASTIEVKEIEVTIIVRDNALQSILITSNGSMSTKYTGSKDFGSTSKADYKFEYEITVTTDGDSFEPFDTVNKAK